MADEICLQMHLLNLSFIVSVKKRAEEELVTEICTKQLTGLAGVAAERIHKALHLSGGVDGVQRVLELHPLLNPVGYIDAEIENGRVHVRRSAAHDDGSWVSLCTPASTQPLEAVATAVDPSIGVRVEGTDEDWTLELQHRDTKAKELPEVEVAKFSGGATFQFETRKSLPLTVV
jgi:hypothetical protein